MAVTCVNKTLAVGQQTEQKETANMIALICDTTYLACHLSQGSKKAVHPTKLLYCGLGQPRLKPEDIRTPEMRPVERCTMIVWYQ